MTLTSAFKKYMSRTPSPTSESPSPVLTTQSSSQIPSQSQSQLQSRQPTRGHGVFSTFTIHSSEPSTLSNASIASQDPKINNPSHNESSPTVTTTMLKQPAIPLSSPLPNDIQRQKRQNANATIALGLSSPSPIITVPIPKAKMTPLTLSTSNNSVNSISSPIDIFERNVQSEEFPQITTTSSNTPFISTTPPLHHTHTNPHPGLASSSTNSLYLQTTRPRHLLSENFTSPVLDSTIELISSEKFNETDVIEVPHAHPSQNLFRMHSHSSQNSISGASSPARLSRSFSKIATGLVNANGNGNGNGIGNSIGAPPYRTRSGSKSRTSLFNLSPPQSSSLTGPCTCNCSNFAPVQAPAQAPAQGPASAIEESPLSSSRKSISFYSYLDLINYERMTKPEAEDDADVNTQSSIHSHSNIRQRSQSQSRSRCNCPRHGSRQLSFSFSNSDSPFASASASASAAASASMSRHGTLSLSRRPTNQGCSEDDDAKIDEALLDIKAERERRDQEQAAKQHRRFVYTSAISDGDDDDDEEHEDNGSGSSSNSHSHTHTHTHTQTDADADADDHATGAMDDILTSSPTSNSKGSSAECDESIRPWNPIYAAPGSPSPSPFHSFSHPRHQSIVEELASLKSSKSYTSTNSYFEDELQQESMSTPAVNSLPPLINVCSAGDYLHERTQKLRNSFVAEKKLVNP